MDHSGSVRDGSEIRISNTKVVRVRSISVCGNEVCPAHSLMNAFVPRHPSRVTCGPMDKFSASMQGVDDRSTLSAVTVQVNGDVNGAGFDGEKIIDPRGRQEGVYFGYETHDREEPFRRSKHELMTWECSPQTLQRRNCDEQVAEFERAKDE